MYIEYTSSLSTKVLGYLLYTTVSYPLATYRNYRSVMCKRGTRMLLRVTTSPGVIEVHV